MNITNSQIRARARSTLVGQYKVLILAALLTRLIMLVAGQFLGVSGTSLFAFILAIIISVVLSLISTVFDAGSTYMFLSAARLRPIRVSDLFYGFKRQPEKPMLIGLILLILNFALIIPFLLIGLFLLRDSIPANVVYLSIGTLLLNLPAKALPTAFLLILLWVVPATVLNLTYSMALFLYVDEPRLSAVEMMRKSREFMNGKKMVLLKLLLSFAGYFFLGLMTLGIGFLWITPYINMSQTIFYLENKTSAS